MTDKIKSKRRLRRRGSGILELRTNFEEISRKLVAAETECGRLREALKLVDYAERSRGYPIPKEWAEVVRVARQALKGNE